MELMIRQGSCGTVGNPTTIKDSDGISLHIGDTVRLRRMENGKDEGEQVVAHDGIDFVMGIKDSFPDYKGEWEITKFRDHSEFKEGDRVDDVCYGTYTPIMKLMAKGLFGTFEEEGIVGTPTSLVDKDGLPLCIGDTVLLENKETGAKYGETVVCHDDTDFVMGIHDGYADYVVTKFRDHSEFQNRSMVSKVRFLEV